MHKQRLGQAAAAQVREGSGNGGPAVAEVVPWAELDRLHGADPSHRHRHLRRSGRLSRPKPIHFPAIVRLAGSSRNRTAPW
jgi:hypothetical protein